MDRSGFKGQFSEGQRRAQAALANSPIFVLRELVVEEVNGQLILTGKVDSFYHKQLAQETVRAAVKHLRVVNQVQVVDTWCETTHLPPLPEPIVGEKTSISTTSNQLDGHSAREPSLGQPMKNRNTETIR